MRFWKSLLTIAALGTSTSALAQSCAPTTRGLTEVSGTRLMREGNPWVPHGVVQIAFVAPPAAQQGAFATAYQNYNPGDYSRMVGMGIDSVRLQVSQPGLDPSNPLHDTAFRSKFIGAVCAARAAGLTVLISIQDESQSGEAEANEAPLPNDATRRVWNNIAPVFKDDRGVMYELLNEPKPNPDNDTTAWPRWTTEMNKTIQTVRNTGAKNLVIADGLAYGERLTGAPALTDPLHRVVYASHPYPHDLNGTKMSEWDFRFGDFSANHPVIVTEWIVSKNFYCPGDMSLYSQQMINYLKAKNVGLMAFAWDIPGDTFGSAFYGYYPNQKNTNWIGKVCGDVGFGSGRQVLNWYQGG